MYRFVLMLIIALLPWHAWAANAMATRMALGQWQAVQQATSAAVAETSALENQANPAAQSAGHDCATALPQDAGNAQTSTMDCTSCASCQACHSVALSPEAEKSIASRHPAHVADTRPSFFVSADTALLQKPPIS